jgi:hypothetical protein
MPPPPDVGAAVVAYLRDGCPTSSCRRLFLRALAPNVGFASGCAIMVIAKTALECAGIRGYAHQGAHIFGCIGVRNDCSPRNEARLPKIPSTAVGCRSRRTPRRPDHITRRGGARPVAAVGRQRWRRRGHRRAASSSRPSGRGRNCRAADVVGASQTGSSKLADICVGRHGRI